MYRNGHGICSHQFFFHIIYMYLFFVGYKDNSKFILSPVTAYIAWGAGDLFSEKSVNKYHYYITKKTLFVGDADIPYSNKTN